ncbi:MAG: hypothetical protein V4617_07885 [Gemmatimonadota bacterium]
MSFAEALHGLISRFRTGVTPGARHGARIAATSSPSGAEVARLDALADLELSARDVALATHWDGGSMEHAYHQWGKVVSGYVASLAEPTTRLEVLKRLLFLWWTTHLDPAEVTGISDFPAPVVVQLIDELQVVRENATGDAELDAMLAWYWTVFADPLRAHGINKPQDHVLPELAAMPTPFRHRGLLDCYWRDQLDCHWSAWTSGAPPAPTRGFPTA